MVVASTLLLQTLHQVALLGLLAVHGVLLVALLVGQAGGLVPRLEQVMVGGVVGFRGLAQVKVLVLVDLGELGRALLLLEEVVLGGLDLLVRGSVLPLLVAIDVAEAIDLLLVAATLFLQLLQLEVGGVDVLAKRVRMVSLGLSLALEPENLSLTAANLLSQSSNLNLHIVVRP